MIIGFGKTTWELDLRKDPNRVLTTILWGNVAINVLLTLLVGSIVAVVQTDAAGPADQRVLPVLPVDLIVAAVAANMPWNRKSVQ